VALMGAYLMTYRRSAGCSGFRWWGDQRV